MLPAPRLTKSEFASNDAAVLTQDFRKDLRLKKDHAQKPFWVLPDNHIILESSSPVYREAEALLIAIADPVSRTRFLQEYELKPYSLYAGASMGLRTKDILSAMERFSKNELPPAVRQLIHNETSRYGKVKLVMRSQRLFVECRNKPEVLEELLRDPTLAECRFLLRLERMQLRVNGRLKKAFNGTIRFLPSEILGTLDGYRRLELRYENMTGLRVVQRTQGGPIVAGSALFELRFRLDVGEDELKRFHNTLALESREFDSGNPAYDPQNSDHELAFGFANEADRRQFGDMVLPPMRALAKQTTAHETAGLDNWLFSAAPGAGGGVLGTAAGPGPSGAEGASAAGGLVADGAEPGPQALTEEEEFRRRAEDHDDDEIIGSVAIEDFEVDPSKVKEVKARCRALKWPLLEEYDFRNDASNPDLPIELKHDDSRIRDYQEQALTRVFGNHRARSGIIVLPCGAGKTLVGIVAACTVKKSTLVLCNSSVSVNQWYEQFRMWANIELSRMHKFTSNSKEPLHKDACILISTYNMIGYTGRRAADTRALMESVSEREWGLVILDEVHVAPADTFLTCMTTRTRSRCKLGLTATLVREDEGIAVLEEQIGPKLFEANWLDLQERGFIANVSCAEVWCEMTPEFYREYVRAENSANVQRLLYAMNPNKFRTCEYLMRYHEERGDKIIIFSDNVFALREYALRLQRPAIDGGVANNERMRILTNFKTAGGYNTVLISKVGDTSIDLPEANVIIQVASHFGARRQEAQRLGRILRPKARVGSAFNAFFYTLISRDTKEMYYSGKRQQFLVDQGYSFKVISELPGMDSLQGLEDRRPLAYSSQADQLNLLTTVLTNDESALARANEADDQEAARAGGGEGDGVASGAGVKRKEASMSTLSGAGSERYAEVAVGAQSQGQGRLVRELQKAKKARQKAAASSR